MEVLQQVIFKPVYQATACLLLFTLLLVALRPVKADTVWTVAGAVYVLFIVLNSIMVWSSDSRWTYLLVSLLISITYLLVVNSLISIYSKLIKLDGSGESSMIFLVIMYHPLTLLFVMFLKWVYFKIF